MVTHPEHLILSSVFRVVRVTQSQSGFFLCIYFVDYSDQILPEVYGIALMAFLYDLFMLTTKRLIYLLTFHYGQLAWYQCCHSEIKNIFHMGEMLEIYMQTSYDQNVQLILKSYLLVVYGTPIKMPNIGSITLIV
jgi:hypothetical protein